MTLEKALREHLEWLKTEHRTAFQHFRTTELEEKLNGPRADIRYHWQGQSKAFQRAIKDTERRLINAGYTL